MRSAVVAAASIALATLTFCSMSRAPDPTPILDPMNCETQCENTMYYQLDLAFSQSERAAILEAMGAWTTSTGGRECFEEGVGTLFLRSSSAEEIAGRARLPKMLQPVGLYDHGKIWLLSVNLDYAEMVSVTAHEIGHARGFAHIVGRRSVMNPAGGSLESGLLPVGDRTEYCTKYICTCPRSAQ